MRGHLRSAVLVGGAILTLAGCDRVFGLHPPPTPDAPPIAGSPFGVPALIDELRTTAEEDDPSLTEDQLELYFLRARELWRSVRASPGDSWAPPALITELNTAAVELRPCVSADGLTLYFTRDDGVQRDVFVSQRGRRDEAWGPAAPVAGNVNDPVTDEIGGWPSPDGLTLLFESSTPPSGQHDLYRATRGELGAPFTREELAPFNLPTSSEGGAWATSDGTNILFESNRSGTMAIWEAIQVGDTWEFAMRDELDSVATDGTPWLSSDGRTVVFSSNRNGSDDLFIATR